MQKTRGSFQLMKSLNRSIILNKIRLDGPISRADIAKQTGLTPPTVSSNVKELIESGLVIESSLGKSLGGGRKPIMLELNASSFYVIGLDVGPKYLRIILSDLTGQLIESSQVPIPTPITNDDLLKIMKQSISPILTKYKKEKNKFIGIGVGMHGVVNVKAGISLYAPSLHLKNISIKQALEKEYNLLVKVENDARVMALGEAWFGNSNDNDNVVTINVGRGIGAGIILNGKLFYGSNFIAGEIGHMIIDINGPKCDCGNFGCLQALAAGPAIAERTIKEMTSGNKSLLNDMVDDFNKITGEIVYQAALHGDPLSLDMLKQTGSYLGIGLTNLIHTLNPEKIIIGGGVSNAGDLLLNSIKETIEKSALTVAAKQTSISLSKLGEYVTAMGASALILVELFSSDHY